MSRIRYSEIFYSFQGEAEMAGVPAVWLRFFGCNLNCNGFGQKDPTDPSTYELPYQEFDPTTVTRVEDLPVWSKGCDSSYSWSAKFKHLAHDGTAEEVARKLVEVNTSEHNPEGLFKHPKTGQDTMLCFTGGEPMMNQKAIIEILRVLDSWENSPEIVTIETNGTRPISKDLVEYIATEFDGLWHWAMSPKLFSVTGERDVFKPDVLFSYFAAPYHHVETSAVLKVVCNGSEACWDELEERVAAMTAYAEEKGYWYGDTIIPPVWVMPVGAIQEDHTPAKIGPICIEAMRRGYNVATRNQVPTFGNRIGT